MNNKTQMNTSLEDHIGIEQCNALYTQMPMMLVGTIMVYVIVVPVVWQHFPLSHTVFWTLTVLLLVVGRWLATRKFTSETTDSSNYKKRLNIFTFWFVMSGLDWGIVGILFHTTDTLLYTLYLICISTGNIAISMATTSMYMRAFLGFSIPAVLFFIVPFVIEGTGIYLWLALSAPVYLILMTTFARAAAHNFKTAKCTEYENSSLLLQVTEEKNRAEIAVSQVTKEKNRAQAAVDDKNQFLAAISHDLRQPLHAMNLYLDALTPRLVDPMDKNILDKISMSGSALNDLLHGLLDISRLDANVVEYRPQHLMLSLIANELKNEFLPQAKELGHELIIDVDNQHVVYVDPVLIERVIRNLLSNAIKFTEKGRVILSSSLVGSKVKITVSDTGMGVAEDKISGIFSEFTQIGNPERDRNKGVGLGLSIVKRLCDLQNINLQFESKLNQGTQVSLELDQGDPALLPLIASTEGHGFESLSILFVDDEETIRDGMEMIIQSWKCQPLIASDGESAMKLVRDLDVNLDLIISDLRLRDEESGIDVIEAIREELNEDVPAIVVTGDTAVDRIELFKNSNLVLMHKPLKPADLRQEIQNLLNPIG